MHRRVARPLAVLAALLLVLAGCSSDSAGDGGGDEASETTSATAAADDADGGGAADEAASVNGEVIPNDLFETMASAAEAQAREAIAAASENATEGAAEVPSLDDEQLAEQRRQVLSSLIASEVVTQFAASQDIELSDDDVQDIVDEGGEELAAAAEGSGLDAEQYARLFPGQEVLINRIVDEALADVEVTPEMAEGLATATVSHILVETEEEAQAALERLESGEEFAAVAEEVSIDGSGQSAGGSLGEAPLNQYVPEFAQAAAEAPIGEVVGPVQTQFGFHLILVEERNDPDLEEIDEDQRRQLLAESPAGQEALAPLSTEFETAFDEADIQVAERYGVWDPAQRAVVTEDQVGAGDSATPGVGTPPAGSEAPGSEAPQETPATPAPSES